MDGRGPEIGLSLDLFSTRHNTGRMIHKPNAPYFTNDRQSEYGVERIRNERDAKPFVLSHHYAGSFPAAIASYGLFRKTSRHETSSMVGTCVFSVPMNVRADLAALLEPGEKLCDLGRLVLLDDVGCNAETWFLSRARAMFAADRTTDSGAALYPIITAFSDPVPRYRADGSLVFPGHYGVIYQASSSLYHRRGNPKTMWIARDGTAIVARSLSKVRNDESGAEHVRETLARLGAPPARAGESGAEWLKRTLDGSTFRAVRHRGNHLYLLAGGTPGRRRRLKRQLAAADGANGPTPFPKRTDRPV